MNSERPLVPTQTQEQARPMLLAHPQVHGTTLSMANQGNLEKAKVGTKPTQVGQCMECGGDHWMKDFPHRKQPVKVKTKDTNETFLPIVRQCHDFLVRHLSKDFSFRKVENNVSGKTTLTYVEVIPSPQTSETEIKSRNIRLWVITRAQARETK